MLFTKTNQEKFWARAAVTKQDLDLVLEFRERIYRDAGKVASERAYQSSIDHAGTAYLVGRGERIIGTFSVCDLGRETEARNLVSEQWQMPASELERSLYVYFFGLDHQERSSTALKFVFGEVFKYLVRHRLEDIYILADARLSRRYRWIGYSAKGRSVLSTFPKSGWLNLMHTRQIRRGVYGLHADPIRWNWYLRSATAELLREGSFPRPLLVRTMFHLYSLFAPLASAAERLASPILRRGKDQSRSSRRIVDVRAV